MTDIDQSPAIDSSSSIAAGSRLTPNANLKRVILLANPASGSVGPRAPAEAAAILARYDLEAEVVVLEGATVDEQIEAALEARPDAVLVLAGDGTAGAVASRAGPDGPLVAPLPGGTMNMLPKALYGTTDWKEALRLTLEEGEAQYVAGGQVAGRAFYCVAILGSPALWAPAREAIRSGKMKLAFVHARRALRRAFTGRIRYSLDGSRRRKTEALALISPMISRAMTEPIGLEAAAMDPADAGEAFRLAAHAVFNDWRRDPKVATKPARRIEVTARSRIPAVIDGEPMLLSPHEMVTFKPRAFRALVPKTVQEESVT